MDLVTIALFILGLALLIVGAEFLVRGASCLAALARVSPLVIGLTVVAYGTSSPELAVSVQAARAGSADLAVGNVLGSNIFNVLLILGVSSLVAPLIVARQLVRLEVPLMILTTALLWVLALDGTVGRIDGVIFFLGGIGYTAWCIRQSRRDRNAPEDVAEPQKVVAGPAGMVRYGLYMLIGLAGLGLGARWLVNGATEFARYAGLSELVIGLTIVAAGTSLPEVATSILASLRGERDIAVGNVVGSNLFNILGVLGIAAIVAPAGIAVPVGAVGFDIPICVAVSIACLPIFFTGYRIDRWEGLLFLAYYIAYTTYLILRSQQHETLPLINAVMLGFVLPLTAITLAVLAVRAWRGQRDLRP